MLRYGRGVDTAPLTLHFVRTSRSRAILRLTGVVDRTTGALYIHAAGQALDHADHLDVDLAGVAAYDGMGLAAFVSVHAMATEAAKHVTLVNLRPSVAARLHRTGIHDLLTNPTADPSHTEPAP